MALCATRGVQRGGNHAVGLASLDTLIARHAAAGLDVSLASQGIPQPLESATDQAAYRILQEALTNAARHGPGRACFRPDALRLTIGNPAPGESPARSNGGHGLIRMRERASLLGGSLDADQSHGTFRVGARLPYGAPET